MWATVLIGGKNWRESVSPISSFVLDVSRPPTVVVTDRTMGWRSWMTCGIGEDWRRPYW